MKKTAAYLDHGLEVIVPVLVTAISPSLAVIAAMYISPALAGARRWMSSDKQ